ncbi:MAG TPA: hypothetical protein VIK99_02415, partial [Thermaerobacter sp.]
MLNAHSRWIRCSDRFPLSFLTPAISLRHRASTAACGTVRGKRVPFSLALGPPLGPLALRFAARRLDVHFAPDWQQADDAQQVPPRLGKRLQDEPPVFHVGQERRIL